MAVYSKLLLSTGGGIISSKQQAEQVENTASILIGLGGTGIDCIKTIKAAVRERLAPDDPNAIVTEYSHIQFLGVDTDKKSFKSKREDSQSFAAQDLRLLDDTEIFDISNPNIGEALGNARAINMRPELGWLRYEDIEVPDLTDAGAGGFRQVGRYMMMDKSADFMDRVSQLINTAKNNLVNPDVNIHIFSGLSGGTGSGSFLDVCYMVKKAAALSGGATVYGYFFLPDVNLSNIPLESRLVRDFIPRNGYAAMQELDYCMRLSENGGSFIQTYKGNKEIKWQEPPVTMCHLICATDTNNNVIPNAYLYAMNVTAEYVMDFLTEPKDRGAFGIRSHLANFRAMVAAGDENKIVGTHLAYCILGASCASVPLREINTYLASQLFDQFAKVQENMPTELAVKQLANDAAIGDYDALLRELADGASDSYALYPGVWKEIRDYGDDELISGYTNQTAEKKGRIEANAKSMLSEKNSNSLISRVRAKLAPYVKDIHYGPLFAYRMLEAAQSHNLLNIVDGLIETNHTRWNDEKGQDRFGECEEVRDDFKRKPNKKRFAEYEWGIEILEKQKRSLYLYEQMDRILVKFRKQIEDCTASYYIVLTRVMDNLISTFKENKAALASEKQIIKTDEFAVPLMTIKELQPKLDETIEPLNISGMLNQFMGVMLENEQEWIQEDENKIARLVTSFFVDTAFSGFANRTITAFLADKYDTTDNETITNRLFSDYIKDLAEKAKPLFAFNTSVWDNSRTGKLAFISVPKTAAAVVAAADRLHTTNELFKVKESALTDRIYLMYSSCALPLGSYSKCIQYEQEYFSSEQAGRHYYEGKPDTMLFNDWRKLPSLTPESHIDYSMIPLPLKRILEEAVSIYDKACKASFIQGDSICKLSDESIKKLEASITRSAQLKSKSKAEGQKAKLMCANAAKELEEAIRAVEIVPTNYILPSGYRANLESEERIRRDYFVSSPVFHSVVKESIDMMDKAHKALMELQAYVEILGDDDKIIEDFCHALFAGIFQFKMVQVTYHKVEFGITTEIPLSKFGAEFHYGSIPLYQAMLTFKQMDAQEKKEICTLAEERINNGEPQMIEAMKNLAEHLTDQYNNTMAQNAAKFPAEYEEIIAFIKNLNREFVGLKGMLGL